MNRLELAKSLLDTATQAVQLKRMLLKDQLRNAVVKAVHVKQYEQTEKELAEAVSGLIKKQFADAGRKFVRTKDELKLIEKGDLPGHPFRGNQWSDGQGGGGDLSFDGEFAPEQKTRILSAIDAIPSRFMAGIHTISTSGSGHGYSPDGILSIDTSDLDDRSNSELVSVLRHEVGHHVGMRLSDEKYNEAAASGLDSPLLQRYDDQGVSDHRMAAERVAELFRVHLETGGHADIFDGWDSSRKPVTNLGRDLKSPSFTSTKSPSAKDIFDPRDWDNVLIDTCLPVLMKHAGEAAAAQMVMMGVDVVLRKKVGRTEKGDLPGHPFRGNQWTGDSRAEGIDWGKRGGSSADDLEVVKSLKSDILQELGLKSDFDGADFCTNISVDLWDKLGRPRELVPYHVERIDEDGERWPHTLLYSKSGDYTIDPAGKQFGRPLFAKHASVRGSYTNFEIVPDVEVDDYRKENDERKSRARSFYFLSTKTTATDWLLENTDVAGDLLWPEVFTLPSGAVVDMGFATEWPDWMKTEISKQIKETFEQPFWAGINDTTASGIESHIQRGLEEGKSIREIRDEMVGDGLDEYYHNRGINIARTESGNALNGARSAAMDRLAEEVPGLKVKRTWMSVLGTTTRDTHANLDGVPADRDGLWHLGGVRVPWPGHWNLPANERCNCQCTLVWGYGMGEDAAQELIEEYNERLAEERSARSTWNKHFQDRRKGKDTKGDLPGHPFRGNQWTGGRSGSQGSADGDVDLDSEAPPNPSKMIKSVPESSVRSDNVLTEGGANTSRVVEIEGEDGITRKYCFKPDDGENPRVNPAYLGHQSVNEVAASIIDEEMGLGICAKTEMAEIGGKTGSLQQWINDDAQIAGKLLKFDKNDEIVSDGTANAEGIADMMYYDALIGNTDRHLGNWLVKDGQVKLIDNGMSMARNEDYEDPRLNYRTLEHAGSSRQMPMTQEFRTGLSKIFQNREQVDARLETAGVTKTRREAFWKRAEYMTKIGKFGLGFSRGTMMDLGRLAEGRGLF